MVPIAKYAWPNYLSIRRWFLLPRCCTLELSERSCRHAYKLVNWLFVVESFIKRGLIRLMSTGRFRVRRLPHASPPHSRKVVWGENSRSGINCERFPVRIPVRIPNAFSCRIPKTKRTLWQRNPHNQSACVSSIHFSLPTLVTSWYMLYLTLFCGTLKISCLL